MSYLVSVLRKAGLTKSAGFTLVSQAIAVSISAMTLLGGWALYRDFSMQWRVANAERQMNQYAHAAMTEMINILERSMGAYELAGGRNPLWRIAIGEFVNENGGLNGNNPGDGHFPYNTDNFFTTTQFAYTHNMYGGYITLSHAANGGIKFNGSLPKWASSQAGQYVWRGTNTRNRDQVAAMDRRDQMTVKSFAIDIPLENDPALFTLGTEEERRVFKHSAIKITLVMQYRYRASYGVGIYGDEYIRERIFETSVCPLNYGTSIDNNFFFEHVIVSGLAG